jgi:microcin C transport system permease protein
MSARTQARVISGIRVKKFKDLAAHLTLPILVFTLTGLAGTSRFMRSSMLEVLRQDYILTARAKGLSEGAVLYGHVFRNAMLIVIAGFPAALLGVFFGSSLLIEMIFSLDGLGQLFYKSAVERDYPVLFGTLYIFALVGLLIGIISDLMYVWIDPRIDFEKRG